MVNSKNFAVFGVAGYVAPRHLKAIKETGNRMVAAYDKSDSVGIIDAYFPDAAFFTEMELFDRHVSKMKNTPNELDYISICTPNYLHDAHTRYALRLGTDVICEKPLVLNPWNVDFLQNAENETGHRVSNILQLRLHPSILALKNKIENGPEDKIYDVDLTYITARGSWYYTSWKGNESKSGGVATNIGVHFYDMLYYIFGKVEENIVHISTHDRVAGFLRLKKARVRYFLSINKSTLPNKVLDSGKSVFRQLVINNEIFEFSEGFTDLHSESYHQIMRGNGFGLDEVRPCVQMIYEIRNARPIGLKGDYHPFAKLPCNEHPFGV